MKITDPIVDNIIRRLGLQWEKGPLITIVKPPASSFLDETIATYISFEDVYGIDAKNSMALILEKIRRYDSVDLIQTLAKINYLIAVDYSKKGKVPQNALINELVSPLLQTKTLEIYSRDSNRRFLYRHQLLCAIRLAISNSPNAGIMTKDDIYGVGEILLRISGLFGRDFPTEEEISSSEDKKDEFVAKGMTSVAVSGHEQFRYRLSRYWQIYFYYFQKVKEKMPKQHLNIEHEFNSATGLDLMAFIGLAFGVWGLYQMGSHARLIKNPVDFLIGPDNFKSVKSEVREKIENIFRWLSSSLQEHQQDIQKEDSKRVRNPLYAFETVWRRPLLKVSEGKYFPLDMDFLEDKATVGVYGTLHDYYLEKNEKRSRDRLKTAFGRAVELYVDRAFRRIGRKLKHTCIYYESHGDQTEGIDIVVEDNDSLFLFEVTTATLTHEVTLSGDHKRIKDELEKLFFRLNQKGGAKGRIRKFDDIISKIKSGTMKILNGKTFKNIYPVVIFEKGLPFIGWKLYLDVIRQSDVVNKDSLTALEFIDLEELEILEAEIHESPHTFEHIRQSKINSVFRNYPLKNYFLYTRKKESRNKFLRKYMEMVVTPTMRRTLFSMNDVNQIQKSGKEM